MKPRFSPTAFMAAYCIAYSVALALDLPLFIYYPLGGDFVWGPHPAQGLGPGMAWYGIMADALIAAVVAALVVPQGWIDRLLRHWAWVIPVVAMLVSIWFMRGFFA